MIDVTKFDFSRFKTAEEKLIAFYIAVAPPMRQVDLITALKIDKSKCIKNLKEIEKTGKFEKFLGDYGAVLYKSRCPEDTSRLPEAASPLNVNVKRLTKRNLTNKMPAPQNDKQELFQHGTELTLPSFSATFLN